MSINDVNSELKFAFSFEKYKDLDKYSINKRIINDSGNNVR
jgi:hypothetical protein